MDTKQSFWFLENLDVGGIFCPKKIGKGEMDVLPHKGHRKGDFIYLPEDSADKVYFITTGRIKIGSYSSSGKEITKAILHEGEVFGELSLVSEERRRDFAVAMEDTELCVLAVSEMRNMMREHSTLNLYFLKLFSTRKLEMEQRLESMVFKDSRTRIIEYLHQLGTDKGKRIGYEMLVRKFMTHQEIANITATSRQTVTTVLNDLRNKNILTFNRRRMLIRDMELLRKAAEGEVV